MAHAKGPLPCVMTRSGEISICRFPSVRDLLFLILLVGGRGKIIKEVSYNISRFRAVILMFDFGRLLRPERVRDSRFLETL